MPPRIDENDGPRIYSKARHAWINYRPSLKSGWIGWMGLGDSVKLKSDKPVPGSDCGTFYEVEPRGFVCLDQRTTLDPKDPGYLALKHYAPKLDTPHPHLYGESRGAPRYYSIPSAKAQRQKEFELDKHMEAISNIRSGTADAKTVKVLEGVDTKPANVTMPELLKDIPAHTYEERDFIGPGSAIAWTTEFDAEGRTWLVTPDFTFMPKDKVIVYPPSSFHGVKISKDNPLPIAFMRKKDRPKYSKKPDGTVASTGEVWPRLAWVGLTGDKVKDGDHTYLVTKDGGLLIDKDDATVVQPSPRTPWGAAVEGITSQDEPVTVGAAAPPAGRRTWAEVSVLSGWLIAYEDTRPVFATLIAPGRGGVPVPGRDVISTASTPTGAFRVDGKFWTGTMTNKAWVHADVPFILNFHGPHALHMAYWHDDWGEKKSGGCINLAPIDARWFFLWADPPIPSGWHGIRSDQDAGPATMVIVHR